MRVVGDIETLKPFFCVTFLDYDTDQTWKFVISRRQNQLQELKQFMYQVKYLIGFNSIDFDSTILNWMINQPHLTVDQIYRVAQVVIDKDHRWDDYQPYSKYKYKSPWKNIDLFLYWSKMLRLSKKLSLKYFAVNLNLNVQEMPIPHYIEEITEEQENEVLDYNLNDCIVTRGLARKLKEDINLRVSIQKDYGLDAISWDAPKIASELLLDNYCRATYPFEHPNLRPTDAEWTPDYLQYWEYKKKIRNTRYERESFKNGDYLPQINFKTPVFQELYKRVCNSYDGFSEDLLFKRFDGTYLKISYGSGGIHSVNKNEVYKSTDEEDVETSDVASLYPTLLENMKAVRPELALVIDIYIQKKKDRLAAKAILKKAKKDGDKATVAKYQPIDTLLKLILNSLTGLLDNEHSWLYSPPQIMALRIMGQMILTRLTEECNLNQFKVVSLNTDGIEVIIPKARKQEYYELVKGIEKEFNLEFEHETYKAIYYKTVNDYLAIKADNSVKVKGEFIYEKVLDGSNEFLIIPLAVKEYFLNGTPVEETVTKHRDIYDFCSAKKVAKNYKISYLDRPQQQLNRFYVSKRGAYLYKSKYRNLTAEEIREEGLGNDEISNEKKTKIGSKLHIMKDTPLVIINETPSDFPNDVEYSYYIKKAKEVIRVFEPNQLTLF